MVLHVTSLRWPSVHAIALKTMESALPYAVLNDQSVFLGVVVTNEQRYKGEQLQWIK